MIKYTFNHYQFKRKKSYITLSLVDFVIPAKTQSLLEAYGQWRERADAKVCCDYGLHVAITNWNEQVEKDMEILTKEKGFLENLMNFN